MTRENTKLGKGLFLGFLAGGAIGAIIALLYAPKPGKELRADIKEKTDEYMNEADKYINQAKDKAKNMINEGKKKSEQLIADAKHKSEDLLKDAEKVYNTAKEKTTEYVSKGKDTIDSEKSKIKTAWAAGVDAYKETKGNNEA